MTKEDAKKMKKEIDELCKWSEEQAATRAKNSEGSDGRFFAENYADIQEETNKRFLAIVEKYRTKEGS